MTRYLLVGLIAVIGPLTPITATGSSLLDCTTSDKISDPKIGANCFATISKLIGTLLTQNESMIAEISRLSNMIPSGAILAFDENVGCPAYWKPYTQANGRVIIGAGKGNVDEYGKALSDRPASDTGGAEKHRLSDPAAGAHSHQLELKLRDVTYNGNYLVQYPAPAHNSHYFRDYKRNELSESDIELADKGEKFIAWDNPPTTTGNLGRAYDFSMPPFIALNYCIKD